MMDKKASKNEEIEKNRNFFMSPHSIIDSGLLARMKPSELKVYLVIGRFAHYTDRRAFPSIALICKLSGSNKNAVCKATKKLVYFGLIEKHRAPKGFKFRNVYKVLKNPKINPLIIPQKVEKRTERYRKKDGKWGVIPQNVELHTFPQKMESKEKEIGISRDSFYKKHPTTLLTEEEKRKLRAAEEKGHSIPPALRKALEEDGAKIKKKYIRNRQAIKLSLGEKNYFNFVTSILSEDYHGKKITRVKRNSN